jgi:CDP-alcohol phosphatidyltransferase
MSDVVPYEQTLKPKTVETPLDLHFFRPVAHVFVQMALPTPLSANGMTVLSILIGLAGSSMFRYTTRFNLIVGSALMVLYAILDCADGQLARARGTSSRLGRILDGMSDYIVGLASGIAVSVHLYALDGTMGTVLLAAGGLGSVILQGTLFDYFKNRYLALSNASYREGNDLAETEAEIADLQKKGGSLALPLYRIYAVFLRVQGAAGGGSPPAIAPSPEKAAAYAERLAPIARGFAWLGPSTHVTLLAVFACAGSLPAYVWLRLTVGNVALAALWLAQRSRERAIAGS